MATFSEVQHLVRAMGDEGAGIFQLAMERGGDNEMMAFYQSLIDLSAETGRPVTFGSLSRRERPGQWRVFYDMISEGNRNGANVFTQVHAREINSVLSFETSTPFDKREVWRDIRALPLEAQKKAFADPETRARLIEVASREHDGEAVVGAEARPAGVGHLLPHGPHPAAAPLARRHRRRARRPPGRGDDRHRAGARPQGVLPPADRQ